MARLVFALLAVLALAGTTTAAAATAQPTGRVEHQGFVVLASIVTDPDWREKWNTSPVAIPHFQLPRVMRVGDRAWVLTFFSGAELREGTARLHCDVSIRDPEGIVHKHPPRLCYEGPADGPPGAVYMTALEIGFEVAENDFSGLAEFEVGITDLHRGLRLPVTVSVEFETGNERR